jgi:hemerythrin superfamily protein
VVGLAAFAALRRVPVVRAVAWIGGLGAALATIFVARRGVRAIEEAPVVPIAVDDQPYDVVTVLIEQHQRIEAAFAEVLEAVGQHRVEAFAALVDLLRYHERAERDLVHPLLRPFAAEVADARLAEEDAADRALASLVSRGVADPAFEAGLIRLQRLVSDHAAHEEAREFPLLRSDIAPARLRDVAGQVRWTS